MSHLNFPDSFKVPFCVAQKFKVRPIPWFGLFSFSFRYRHRTLIFLWTTNIFFRRYFFKFTCRFIVFSNLNYINVLTTDFVSNFSCHNHRHSNLGNVYVLVLFKGKNNKNKNCRENYDRKNTLPLL